MRQIVLGAALSLAISSVCAAAEESATEACTRAVTQLNAACIGAEAPCSVDFSFKENRLQLDLTKYPPHEVPLFMVVLNPTGEGELRYGDFSANEGPAPEYYVDLCAEVLGYVEGSFTYPE